MNSESALIIEVPESEEAVGSLRDRYDPVSKIGMPAHITILYPFIDLSAITSPDLKSIQSVVSGFKKFRYLLDTVDEFSETIFLSPTPKKQFVNMTESLVQRFPDYPPFGGIHDSVVPHLSVSNRNMKDREFVRKELFRYLTVNGVVHAKCKELALFGSKSGRWKKIDVFPLSG